MSLVNLELRLSQRSWGAVPESLGKYCPDKLLVDLVGGVPFKSKRKLDCNLRGMEKNGSFKSRVVNQLVTRGIVPRRI